MLLALLVFVTSATCTSESRFFERSVSVGEQNNYGFEVHGTQGAVFWDFRLMGELGVSTGTIKSQTRHALRRLRELAPELADLVGVAR